MLGTLILALAAGTLIAVLVVPGRRRRALTQRAAKRLGGVVQARSVFANRESGVVVEHGDVEVSFAFESAGDNIRCVWVALASRPTLPAFRVYRRSASSRWSAGRKEMKMERSADFDQHFAVESQSTWLMKRVWSEWAMDEMLHRFPDSVASSNGRQIRLEHLGNLRDEHELDAGVRLVASLAGADVFGVEALRALDGAGDIAPAAGFPAVRIAGASDVVIGPVSIDAQIRTRARVPMDVRGNHDIVAVRGGEVIEVYGQAPLPKAHHRLARALGDADIEWERHEVRVTWTDIETDPEALEAGIALLRSLAAPAERGVFR